MAQNLVRVFCGTSLAPTTRTNLYVKTGEGSHGAVTLHSLVSPGKRASEEYAMGVRGRILSLVYYLQSIQEK